ncbi:MAG: hypothetical protein AAGF31_06395 [Planctomycetota bacterium]
MDVAAAGEGGGRRLDVLVGATPRGQFSSSVSRSSARQEPIWLPAGMLAVLATLAMALSATGAPVDHAAVAAFEQDAFESASDDAARAAFATPAVMSSLQATASPQSASQRIVGQWRAAASPANGRATSATKSTVTQLRFTAPTVRQTVVSTMVQQANVRQVNSDSGDWNYQVRTVAFDEDQFSSDSSYGQTGSASMQSIQETGFTYRTAQNDEPDFGAELQRQLEEPFGAEELPPLDETPAESDETPDPFDMLPEDEGQPMDDSAFDDFGDEPMDDDMGEPEAQVLPPLEDYTPPEMDDFDQPEMPDPADDAFDNTFDQEYGPADSDEDADERKRREESEQSCAEELAELKANRLSMVDISIGVSGDQGQDYPYTCSIDDGQPFAPRSWVPITYMWKASALCHKPLYFEQKALERYGHSFGPYLDPVVAGAHFFTRLPVLPYCMGLKTPTECVYTLGHYRPGNCAPYLVEQPGITCRAVGFELGAWTGGSFLIP